MSKAKQLKMLHYVSAALLAMILICQFTPFWHFSTESGAVSSSISGYIWFPADHADLESCLKEQAGPDFRVDQLVLPSVLVMLLSAAGVVLCLIRNERRWTGLLPLSCGIIGTWGSLTHTAFRLGSFHWLYLILYVLVMLLGAYTLFLAFRKDKSE